MNKTVKNLDCLTPDGTINKIEIAINIPFIKTNENEGKSL